MSTVNILLVDDEPNNLEVLEAILRAPDYRLVRALDANETLLALLQDEFAVIVLDIQMPGMTGIELAHLIKQRQRTQHVPIIFLTAFYEDERRMLEGYSVGAVDYLTKPVNRDVLRSKVGVFVDLYRKNHALAQEIAQRQQAEEALREANEALEDRVAARTAELSAVAQRSQLLSEVATDLLKVEGPPQLFDDVFARVAGTVQADAWCCHLRADGGLAFALSAASGLRAGTLSDLQSVAGETISFEGVNGRVKRELPDATVSCHPLTAGGMLLGVFTLVLPKSAAALDEKQRQFVHTACDLVAAGLERARLLGEAQRARERAEQAGRTKDDFLAALSHELRTPLNPVLLIASEAATNAGFSEEVRAQFAMIRKNVELEARLIDDLLDLTRITRGKLPLEIKPHKVQSILDDALATVRAEIEQKDIALQVEVVAEGAKVAGDHVRLQQVFWNLLKNAVKFTPAGGRIDIASRVSADGDRVAVSISDTGIGLSPEEISRVFEAFTQGDHAASGGSHRFGGLGLGLSISRSLIELHGGTLHAESKGTGRGATFTVELPLVISSERTASGDQADSPKPAPSSSPPWHARDRLRTVLLVEDHEPTRVTLEALLRRRAFDVYSSASISGARALASSRKFDVLISDIGLPDGNGFELMKEMKERHGLSGIALTGYGMEEDVERSRSAGFLVHLTKPIRVHALDSALEDLHRTQR